MKKLGQQLQWLPSAKRMLGWGMTMACLWGWFPFIFGGEMGIIALVKPQELGAYLAGDDEFGLGAVALIIAFVYLLGISCLWIVGGAITGIAASFFAPVAEPRNPLKSPFFRAVGKQTFWLWFWSSLSISFCCSLLSRVMELRPAVSCGLYAFGAVASLIFSVQSALSRAQETARTNPSRAFN